jgi:hypothetical protein
MLAKSSRRAAAFISPELALSLSKGRKSWVEWNYVEPPKGRNNRGGGVSLGSQRTQLTRPKSTSATNSRCLRPPIRIHFLALLCAMLLPAAAPAQDASTGAIRGTVSDSAGARIKDCSLAAVNIATGIRYFATSDSEGRFALELLPSGDYLARAESPGMSPQVTPQLHVDLGGVTSIDFKLSIASTKESITVSDAPQWVETQPSDVSSVIDERWGHARPARPDVRFEWRLGLRRHPRLPDHLSGRRYRRQ